MPRFAFSLLVFLSLIDLQSLVPSPGGMGRPEPLVCDLPIPGARVVSPASGEGVSPTNARDFHDHRAKHHEAWATAGLGLVQFRNRCNRLKRSYTRAYFRSLDTGIAMYNNKLLYPAQVPFRIRQLWTQRRRQVPQTPAPHMTPPTSGLLRVLQWNASRSLHYASWLDWCDRSPYDIIIVQETGWSMTNEWNIPQWHVLHGADRYASVLVMVRAALISYFGCTSHTRQDNASQIATVPSPRHICTVSTCMEFRWERFAIVDQTQTSLDVPSRLHQPYTSAKSSFIRR